MTPVFVYGTLRPGCGNDRLWRGKASATHNGDVFVSGYRLVHNGWFPYALADDKSIAVGCLVNPFPAFELEVLARLDALEGVPHHYLRLEVDAHTPDGVTRAWMYVPNYDRSMSNMPAVPGNDWARMPKERTVL
jgi:gamma-glutamylcyclotransferase (GGCT)/AIG2-like uncharacterized protein YtfP